MRYCEQFDPPHADALVCTRLLIVRQLATRIAALTTAIAELPALMGRRVLALGTPLVQLRGVGPVTAARLRGELGCLRRVHSAAALAARAGLAPVAVASGSRHGHRANFGGNRQRNRAIHVIALTQRRCAPLAQADYAKKRAEGKTARAAMRCRKRRLVDVLYRLWYARSVESPQPVAAIAA